MLNLKSPSSSENSLRQLVEKILNVLSTGDDKRISEVLDLILNYFSCDSGTLHFLNPEDQHLYLLAASAGMPEPILEKIKRIPLGKGIAGTVAETRKPLSTKNLQTDSSVCIQPRAKNLEVQGSFCIPLLQDEQVIGTLGLGWRESKELSAIEESQLVSIGWLLAQCLRQSSCTMGDRR